MTPIVAASFLIAYYVLSIEIYLATYCVGRFQMSFWGCGPTELRILLAMGALMLLVKPIVTIIGLEMPLFDVGGIVGTVGLIITAFISAVGNTRRLYAAEPLPQNLISRHRGTETQRHRAGRPTRRAAFFCVACASRVRRPSVDSAPKAHHEHKRHKHKTLELTWS
jgi:hypothetical protein